MLTKLLEAQKLAEKVRDAARDRLREASRPAEVELANAQRELESIQQSIAAARDALILKHIDVLLELRPTHDRTSCSDTDFHSNAKRCCRCALLRTKDYQVVEVDIEVTVREGPR